jgi:hydrogenase maturation protein HypF
LTDDLRRGVARGILSRRFHNGLVDALSDAVDGVAQRSGLTRVCLSGGSFQNAVLSGGLETALARRGLTVFTHALVPAGDGGLSLGQLAIAASRKS